MAEHPVVDLMKALEESLARANARLVKCPRCGDQVYQSSLDAHLDGVHGESPLRRQ